MTRQQFPICRIDARSHPHLDLWTFPSQPVSELWVQGQRAALKCLECLPQQGLAVVGSRQPTQKSLHFLQQLPWRSSGLILISGMARGIDAAVHEAALQSGLSTIAILGSGFHQPYPRENIPLMQRIMEAGGLCITEYSPDTPARPWQFILRNRLIAALAKALLVIEARLKSGSLGTVAWAQELGRNIYTLPCFPGDPTLAGNQSLLEEPRAQAFWGLQSLGHDWLELANHSSSTQHSIRNQSSPLSEDLDAVLKWIERYHYTSEGADLARVYCDASHAGWSAERFFNALSQGISKQRIISKGKGLLPNKSAFFEGPAN